MSSTYTAIYVHVVFATKDRVRCIPVGWRADLHAYMGGVMRRLGAAPLSIGGVEDHVHLLLGMPASACVAALVREVKKASTAWIAERKLMRQFRWQEGYGAFSVGQRAVPAVRRYIAHQEAHHRRRTFAEEFEDFLQQCDPSRDSDERE